jgi:hypothetical protein
LLTSLSCSSSGIVIESCDSDILSRCCCPRRPDKSQLPEYLLPDSCPTVAWMLALSKVNAPVKYLLYTLLCVCGDDSGLCDGEPRGLAGRDLLPRRIALLKPSPVAGLPLSLALKPRINMPPAIIWCATCTTDFPHPAVSPVRSSSVPAGFCKRCIFLDVLLRDSVAPVQKQPTKSFSCVF